MKFELYSDIPTQKNPNSVWVNRGVYPIVRFLDAKRIIIDLGINVSGSRQLTVVRKNKGKIVVA
jgi:hypothetical protein